MKNFKKVVALTLALVMVLSTMTTAFAATNVSKAQTLYDLGLFKGVSSTEFVPALDDATDAAQAMVLIGRALQWEIDPAAVSGFTDVPSWAEGYVAYAVENGITEGVDTEANLFGTEYIDGKRMVTWFLVAAGYDKATVWADVDAAAAEHGMTVPMGSLRDDVVAVIYAGLMVTPMDGEMTIIQSLIAGDAAKTAIAMEAGLIPSELAISSAKATGAKTVSVMLNKAVDTDTTSVVIKKGSAVYSKSVAWNDAKTVATVTSVIDLPAATYTAYVTDADGTVLTATFDVTDESEASIKFTSKVLFDDTKEAEVDFVVYNQYGEDMEVESDDTGVNIVAYNVTQKSAVAVTKDSEQYFLVDTKADDMVGDSTTTYADGTEDEDDFEAGDVVRFTMTYEGMTGQVNLTVADASAVSQIVFGDLIYDDEDATSLEVDDEDAQLVYYMVDQYGDEVILDEADDAAEIEDLNDVVFLSSDEDVIADFYVDDDGLLFLKMGTEDGTAVITAVVNASGSVGSKTVVVTEDAYPDEVEIAAPTEIVAAGDDDFDLEVVISDQYGELLTDVDGYDHNLVFTLEMDDLADVVLTASEDDDVTTVNVDLSTYTFDESKEATITAEYDGDEIGSVTFDVEEKAYVDDFDDITFATVFEHDADLADGTSGAALTIDSDDLVVYDQFGREYEDYSIDIVSDDASVLEATGDTMTAIKVEDTEVKITLTDDYYTAVTVDMDVDVEVIDTDDIDSYAMSEIGTIFNWEDDSITTLDPEVYAAEVTIDGVYNGDLVNLLNDMPDTVTSSSTTYAKVMKATTGTPIDGASAGYYVFGTDEGTTTISVWVDGSKVDSESIAVSNDHPYAVSVEFETDIDETTTADDEFKYVDEDFDYSIYVTVKDQYGEDLSTEFSPLYFSFDGKDITVITSNGLSATQKFE